MRRDMVLRAIGWGTFPRHIIAQELASGKLVELDLSSRPPELMKADLFVIHRSDYSPASAARWMIMKLQNIVGWKQQC